MLSKSRPNNITITYKESESLTTIAKVVSGPTFARGKLRWLRWIIWSLSAQPAQPARPVSPVQFERIYSGPGRAAWWWGWLSYHCRPATAREIFCRDICFSSNTVPRSSIILKYFIGFFNEENIKRFKELFPVENFCLELSFFLCFFRQLPEQVDEVRWGFQ